MEAKGMVCIFYFFVNYEVKYTEYICKYGSF